MGSALGDKRDIATDHMRSPYGIRAREPVGWPGRYGAASILPAALRPQADFAGHTRYGLFLEKRSLSDKG
jgi:hypothetical protein